MRLKRKVLRMAQATAHKIAQRIIGFPELVQGPLNYNQDGLATIHNCDFLKDPHFMEAYRLGEQTGSWGGTNIHWRLHVTFWAAEKASHLEGDFVECGVNRGGFSRAVMHFVDFSKLGKKFYLLDTYEGIDERFISEAERKQGIWQGYFGFEECYEAVRKTFEGLPAVLVRGSVPETLPQVSSEKVAFLSIDMNCAAPEIAAAEYFWPKLVSGAVIVLDDYGWKLHYEQKVAFDRFAKERGVGVLALPTGQGLIFKP